MDLFFIAIDFRAPAAPTVTETFAVPIQIFSNGRNADTWIGKHHLFLAERAGGGSVHAFRSEKFHYTLGRDIGTSINDRAFPYLNIEIDENERVLKLTNDPLGMYTYFYAQADGRFVVSNFFPAVAAWKRSELKLDQIDCAELLVFGTTSPGRTVYQDIKMNHPLENLEFSAERSLRKVKKLFHPSDRRPSAEQIYEAFKRSVRTLLNTSKIRWINLTGGADTRLILSTLSKDDLASLSFIFDEVNSNPSHIPYDRAAVKILAEELQLNIRHRFPNHPLPRVTGPHDGPNAFSPYCHLLTGMYGGETLGGNAPNVLPQNLIQDREPQGELFHHIRERRKSTSKEFREHFGGDLALPVTRFTNSFMSFMYDDDNWSHPYVLTQKKLSPFINTRVLSELYSADLEYLENYRLYAEIFRRFAPRLMKFPFFSRIAELGHEGFARVNGPASQPLGARNRDLGDLGLIFSIIDADLRDLNNVTELAPRISTFRKRLGLQNAF